jgi:hypothetical protein
MAWGLHEAGTQFVYHEIVEGPLRLLGAAKMMHFPFPVFIGLTLSNTPSHFSMA